MFDNGSSLLELYYVSRVAQLADAPKWLADFGYLESRMYRRVPRPHLELHLASVGDPLAIGRYEARSSPTACTLAVHIQESRYCQRRDQQLLNLVQP